MDDSRHEAVAIRLIIGDNELDTSVHRHEVGPLIDRWFEMIGSADTILKAQTEKLKRSAQPLAAAVAANQPK